MDTTSELVPYKSKSLSHRLVVETSLISASHTISGNKASSSTRDIDIIGPMILKGTSSINWKHIAEAQPRRFNTEVIPRHCRKFFQNTFPTSVNIDPPDTPEVSHTYNLRSSGIS